MANPSHHIKYQIGGAGPILERTIVAPKNTDAEQILLADEPNATIVGKILTTIPVKYWHVF